METKICTFCHQEKPLEDFPKQGRTVTGKQKYRGNCKQCHNEDMKARYHKIKTMVESYKEKCEKCGDTRSWVLDFHHKDPSQKEFTIGRMKKSSEGVLKVEIDKCVCLCANCHREFHYFEKESGLSIEEYLSENISQIGSLPN